MKIINPNSPLEFQIPMTGLVVAIDARRDPLEVENEFHYFNNPPTSGSLFDGTVGGETNLVVFVEATILAVRPLDLCHKRLHWQSHRCW